MNHIWRGTNPHRRYLAPVDPRAKGQRRIVHITTVEIQPGEVFEPTTAELKSFGDLLEPVGQSLRVTESDEESEEER